LKRLYSIITSLLLAALACSAAIDSIKPRKTVSRIGTDVNGGYVFTSKGFSGYANAPGKKNLHTYSTVDLTYGFSFTEATRMGRMYTGAYQGAGVSVTTFYGGKSIGTPVSFYLFQGAPVKRISDRLSLDYEWKLGASFGWEKFRESEGMKANIIVGSPVNARINLSFMVNYKLNRNIDLKLGVEGNHFSNGNTAIPNPGVNTIGVSIGMIYRLQQFESKKTTCDDKENVEDKKLKKLSYDVMAYGGKRRQLVDLKDNQRIAVPESFAVAGISLAPMYEVNRYLRTGLSVDLKYDGASNLQKHLLEGSTEDNIEYTRQPFSDGLMGGLSARAEFVMPIFSINGGIGRYVAGVRSVRKFYQTLNLKIHFINRMWVNIGYQLHDFHIPDNLAIGLGYTFH